MRRTMKLGFLALMVAALAFALGNSSMAFHEAAELKCMACHTMHLSENGGPSGVTSGNDFDAAPTTQALTEPVANLLVRSNKTDLCLACHSTNKDMGSGGVAPDVYDTGTDPATPGGDFNLSGTGGGEAQGHNPYHASGGVISQDTTFATDSPPGDTGTLWEWSCLSCHTPHADTSAGSPTGAYAYRLLRKYLKGPGTSGIYKDVSATLSSSIAGANLVSGGVNIDAEAAGNHNVYLVGTVDTATIGFGEWCAGCHGDFHGAANELSDSDWIRHPTYEPLGTTIATNYTTTYDPAYPLEVNTTAALTISTVALTSPDVNAQVSCLSCHKAHATENANSTRWNNAAASGSGTGCNKCHAKGS